MGIDVVFEGENGKTIATDEKGAFEDITSYVIERGHRRIAILKGTQNAQVTHQRYAAFQRAAEKHGK